MTFDDFTKGVVSLVPPAVLGTLIGLAYAQEMTPRQKAVNFIMACPLAIYGAAASKEVLLGYGFKPGDYTVAGLAILYGVVGMDVIGGLVFFFRKFKADPLGTVSGLLNVWRGKP
jgi:uncharacterized membrane protein YeaQ/YmgE (transglycosylase-associated protein family)